MKYCSHCGYKFNDARFEEKNSTYKKYDVVADSETEISYICPRCGHIIHDNLTEEDYKSLSRACHAELQRGRNFFARGMSSISIGVILLVTSIIFLLLSNKIDQVEGGKHITPTAPEFWVSVVLGTFSVILLSIGIINTVKGLLRQHEYTNLLKDINNKTFIQ